MVEPDHVEVPVADQLRAALPVDLVRSLQWSVVLHEQEHRAVQHVQDEPGRTRLMQVLVVHDADERSLARHEVIEGVPDVLVVGRGEALLLGAHTVERDDDRHPRRQRVDRLGEHFHRVRVRRRRAGDDGDHGHLGGQAHRGQVVGQRLRPGELVLRPPRRAPIRVARPLGQRQFERPLDGRPVLDHGDRGAAEHPPVVEAAAVARLGVGERDAPGFEGLEEPEGVGGVRAAGTGGDLRAAQHAEVHVAGPALREPVRALQRRRRVRPQRPHQTVYGL